MAGAVLLGVVGVWLTLQATAGRLAGRLLSYREIRPGEVPAPASTSTPGTGIAGAIGSSSAAGPVRDSGTLSIDDVAFLCLRVGLTPDQAVTATAIAMRESGGRTDAHNPVPPDDSWGLWQINRLAWPQFPAEQLATASGNAAAMLVVSSHGTNWQPWQIGGNPLARTDPAAARAAVDRQKAG
jgi:hypothetical protein